MRLTSERSKKKNAVMDPRRVEMLADRLREQNASSPNYTAVKRHLDAARAKLESLQATRRQLKADLVRVTEERDAAVNDLERLRSHRSRPPITPCDLHERRIAQLKTERAYLVQALEDLLSDLTIDAEERLGPATLRARESLELLQRLDKAS